MFKGVNDCKRIAMVFHLEVFGNNALFQQVSDLHLLEPYMYTKTAPVLPIQPPVETKPEVAPITSIPPPPAPIAPLRIDQNARGTTNTMPGIFPRKPDNLFWCVYIALYGYDTYHEIGHRYGNTEIEEKQKMVEWMKKNPAVAKQSSKKITKALFQEIMSDFMTNKKMTMDMLTMVALYHNRGFIITHLNDRNESEPYYISISGDASGDTQDHHLLCRRGKYDFSIILSPEIEVMNNIANTRFKYENHDMPLKAVSTYKISDLEHIFDVLEIEREKGKKYKKEDYYHSIMLRCGFV